MTRTKRFSVGAIVAITALFASAMIGGTAQAKGKKGGKPVTVTKAVNLPIPDAVGNPGPPSSKTLDGKLATSLAVSKKFKGTVGRVALTFQTTGLAANAAADLSGRLIAPDGTSVGIFGGLGGQSIGPLTIQSNSSAFLCSFDPATQVPRCTNPDQTVPAPYVGTAGDADLNLFESVKGKGNWTFTVYDEGYNTGIGTDTVRTSILNSVTLKLTPQKPVV